jgi:hypothetical protein
VVSARESKPGPGDWCETNRDFTLFAHAEGMVQSADATGTTVFRLPPGSPRAPLLYSLRASRG